MTDILDPDPPAVDDIDSDSNSGPPFDLLSSIEEGVEVKVVRKKDGTQSQTHTGLAVSTGPGVLRLMITWPYGLVGRIVEIPHEEIKSWTPVEPRNIGDTPRTST